MEMPGIKRIDFWVRIGVVLGGGAVWILKDKAVQAHHWPTSSTVGWIAILFVSNFALIIWSSRLRKPSSRISAVRS